MELLTEVLCVPGLCFLICKASFYSSITNFPPGAENQVNKRLLDCMADGQQRAAVLQGIVTIPVRRHRTHRRQEKH